MKRPMATWMAVTSAIAALGALEGCVSVRTAHGYILERGEDGLTAREGIDTKESIIARYGEPSIRGTFDPNVWYYAANRDQARAFFRPEPTAQEVVAFHFDDQGTVQTVEKLDLGDSVKVRMVARETPTRGKELSFWEQLLGNVGQLPAGGVGGAPQGGPR